MKILSINKTKFVVKAAGDFFYIPVTVELDGNSTGYLKVMMVEGGYMNQSSPAEIINDSEAIKNFKVDIEMIVTANFDDRDILNKEFKKEITDKIAINLQNTDGFSIFDFFLWSWLFVTVYDSKETNITLSRKL